MRTIILVISMGLLLTPTKIFAGQTSLTGTSPNTVEADSVGKTERVGGTYIVESVQTAKTGGFRVEFRSELETGKFDRIRLESPNVHVSVKEGQKFRISAEIVDVDAAGVAQASQVLVFLPSVRGPIPVWMLSNKGGSLEAARYLEMNVPLTDYWFF